MEENQLINMEHKIAKLPEEKFKIEHYQNEKTNRTGYLKGLAYDVYKNQSNDRNSHYFGRELMFNGRLKSAIKELRRHIKMDRWVQEKAQSMIYVGDCYKMLSLPFEAVAWYHQAVQADCTRREPLMALAQFYFEKNDAFRTAAYAAAALEIPRNDYYGNFAHFYTSYPYELLYWARWNTGNMAGSKDAYDKAFAFQPNNPKYIHDRKFYYPDAPQSGVTIVEDYEYKESYIDGFMSLQELNWLYQQAKDKEYIVEIGSWKGRSAHALLSGHKKVHDKFLEEYDANANPKGYRAPGIRIPRVFCVDTFKGSADPRDLTHSIAKSENILSQFKTNTKAFSSSELCVVQGLSTVVVNNHPFGHDTFKADMVFIDAGHTKEEARDDIKAWLPKATKIICGHDYCDAWPGVVEAVNEIFGKPDGVEDSIWWVDLEKREKEKVRINPVGPDEVLAGNIPKQIFTIWLGGEMPEYISKCIESQKIAGYKHKLLTLRSIPKDIPYVNKAIKAKKWVKAADYMRLYYLHKYGGIFLDADVEVLPGKNFDSLLGRDFVASREEFNGFVSNAVVLSEKGHPLLKDCLAEMKKRFKGDDDLIFQSGMELFTVRIHDDGYDEKIVGSEYFNPYNHQNGGITITDNTVCFHHYSKSWADADDILPKVSIIIPTLGRKAGLERCLKSIDNLYYPKHLIETIVIPGAGTVPQKVAKGLAKSNGSIIVYAANDIAFTPDSLYIAAWNLKENDLVAFNTGVVLPDEGNICEHFAINKEFISKIGDEIFDKRLRHVGVDNLLWAKAKKYGKAIRLDHAIVDHFHFSTKKSSFDEVYKKGWENVDNDRKLLKKLLAGI